MLTNQDLEILSGMVKNQLEKLILKRANESTSDQAKSALNEEINGLYILLSKVIILIEGNLENYPKNHIELIRELIDELRSSKALPKRREDSNRIVGFADDIQSQQDLARKLIGTCWRKKNGVEVIVFRDLSTFDYFHELRTEWSSHEYLLGDQLENMTLHWKMDNFKARCEFTDRFTRFVEVNNSDLTWTLEWVP